MKVKLGGYIQEYSVRNKANEDIPVYSVTNTQGFCQDYFGKEVASKDKSTYKIVPRGYFAYNPSRINVGSVDWQRDEDQVIVSPLYNVFSVSPELNQQYLYYYLKSDFALHRIKAVATGSVRDNLKLEMLKNFPIRIPSVEEQEYIVQALDKAKNIIDLRRNELQKFDDLIRARFVEMFGDNDKKIAISSLCDVSGGYSFKSEDISSTGFIKILQIGNVYLDDVNWETTNYLPKGFDNVYSRFLLNEGDIVIALTRPIIQSLGNVKACIVKVSDTPCLLNQRVGRIVSKKNVDVNLKFIYGCLMTDDFTRYVESCCIGCSQPNISTKDIENYMIPDASYEKQMDFVKFKEQVDKSKLLSGCRLFHSWAPENRDKPKHVGVPQRKTKVLRGGRRQQ